MKFINVPKLKAVLFDLDGTLFDTDRAIYLSYKEAVEKLGYTLPRNNSELFARERITELF